jgi:hypothetical protein
VVIDEKVFYVQLGSARVGIQPGQESKRRIEPIVQTLRTGEERQEIPEES